jgi:hypothetical protein
MAALTLGTASTAFAVATPSASGAPALDSAPPIAAPPLADLTETPASGANLVIFRDKAMPTVWAATVKIDGKKIASLKDHRYTDVKLDPGVHNIAITWPLLSGQSGYAMEFNVGEEPVSYLGIAGTVDLTGVSYVGGSTVALNFKIGSQVFGVPPEEGKKIVATCCRYVARQ